MFLVTALGQNCWLTPYGPNTKDDAVKIKARVEIDAQRGLTGRSSRRPQAFLLRYDVSWICQMVPADYYAARAAIISAQDEPVLIPFWPAARKTTQAAAMTSGIVVAWTRDWSSYAINPGSLAAYDFYAPVLMGIFTQPPRLTSQNTDFVLAEFVFHEDSSAAAAMSPPAAADVTLATPDGYAAPVFPWSPEGSTLPKLTFGQIDIERNPVGPGRQPSDIYYPQQRESFVQPSYKFKTSADAIALLGWWQRRAGGADSCWVASTQKIGDLTGDLAAGTVSIPTVAAMSVAVGDTLALLTTGLAPEFVRVQSLIAGVPHLGAPTAVAHPKLWSTIVPALLARHMDAELSLDFSRAGDDWIATTTLGFREVASEYAATDGEVRGTTIGRLPANAWLFRIDLDYSGATQNWFLTNWESGCQTPDLQNWEYHDCDFDKVAQSIDLEDDSCTFKIRWWAGCPWENWLPGQLAATGTLTIYRAPVSSAGVVGNQMAVWSGVLSTPEREGPALSVKVLGANTLFSRRCPHQQMTTTCYKRLFGGRCGLTLSQWQHNGTVTAIAGQSVTINAIARTDAGAEYAGFGFQDWFALGYAQRNNGAGQPIRAEVLASTALAGGQITLTLGRALGCNVGDIIIVVPGCDKQRNTCANYDAVNNPMGKFNNLDAFGGFHAMPAVSPNFVIPNSTQTPAKK